MPKTGKKSKRTKRADAARAVHFETDSDSEAQLLPAGLLEDDKEETPSADSSPPIQHRRRSTRIESAQADSATDERKNSQLSVSNTNPQDSVESKSLEDRMSSLERLISRVLRVPADFDESQKSTGEIVQNLDDFSSVRSSRTNPVIMSSRPQIAESRTEVPRDRRQSRSTLMSGRGSDGESESDGNAGLDSADDLPVRPVVRVPKSHLDFLRADTPERYEEARAQLVKYRSATVSQRLVFVETLLASVRSTVQPIISSYKSLFAVTRDTMAASIQLEHLATMQEQLVACRSLHSCVSFLQYHLFEVGMETIGRHNYGTNFIRAFQARNLAEGCSGSPLVSNFARAIEDYKRDLELEALKPKQQGGKPQQYKTNNNRFNNRGRGGRGGKNRSPASSHSQSLFPRVQPGGAEHAD